jgi:hypothetical protein
MSCCKGQKTLRNNKIQKLGGWSFEPELYEFLVANLPFGSTILELGSGYGTDVLSQHYKMFSIEHNEKFLDIFNSHYIYAPMDGYWYHRASIEGTLPEKYDAILVDGPVGDQSRNRIGFWENFDLFNLDVLLVIDDTNRKGERMLFEKILDVCNFDFGSEQLLPKEEHRKFEHFKTFSVIYPK